MRLTPSNSNASTDAEYVQRLVNAYSAVLTPDAFKRGAMSTSRAAGALTEQIISEHPQLVIVRGWLRAMLVRQIRRDWGGHR